MNSKNFRALILTAALSFLVQGAGAEVNVGDIAPDFTALNQWNGYTTLYGYLGQVIIADFSASWCTSCREAAMEVEENIWAVYQGSGVMVITALCEDMGSEPPELEDLQEWANSLGISSPVVDGYNLPWGLAGNYPTYFVLDQNMECRYKASGYDQRAIITWITQLLSNPPTPAHGTPTPTPPPPTDTPEPATPTPTPLPTEPPTATPTSDPSTPTPTPTAAPSGSPAPTEPTPTPVQFEGVRLQLSDDYFRSGMFFCLTARIQSQTYSQADFYCALDVAGSYFFYPLWGEELGSEHTNVPAEKTLLQFTWPAVDGSFSGINFWGLACQTGTYDYFGEIAMTGFSYGP